MKCAVFETHDLQSKNIYNSELAMISKSKIKYSNEIGSNPQRAQLTFIKRVDSINLSPNKVFLRNEYVILSIEIVLIYETRCF